MGSEGNDIGVRPAAEWRRGQSRRLGLGMKLAHPWRVSGIGRKLPALGFFDKLKGALLLNVFEFQLLERGCDFSFANVFEIVR